MFCSITDFFELLHFYFLKHLLVLMWLNHRLFDVLQRIVISLSTFFDA